VVTVVSAFGSGPVAVLAWHPPGFSSVRLRLGGHDVEPDPLEAGLALTHRRRIAATPGQYNELCVAPRSLRMVGSGWSRSCLLDGVVSDYAAYLASMQLWRRTPLERRLDRCRDGLTSLRPHRVGVATTLLCSDGKMVLMRRDAETSWYPGAWAVPAEGAQAEDLEVGEDGVPVWDPLRTVRRGLSEEVGVLSVETLVKFHSVVLDVNTGALSVMGRAEVPMSGARLLEAMSQAADAQEHEERLLLPWSVASLGSVPAAASPLVPNHAFALVAAAAMDVGAERCLREGWLVEVAPDR
jgi:hypothetical protein